MKSKKDIKKTLTKKYGPEIIIDFKNLSKKQFWNLSDIGKKFGFTRERARQIYVSLYNKPYAPIRAKKQAKKDNYTVCVNDPRHKFAEYKKGNHGLWKATMVEKIFFDECNKKEINIKFLCKRAIDIKLNNYFVDVKSAFIPRFSQKKGKAKYFRFIITETQKNKCDFLACYHGKEKKFFIIPRKEFSDSNVIYISETPSTYCTAKNRYWEYKDAWHLLRGRKTT